MTVGSLRVEPSAYTANCHGQEVVLSATEIEILITLIANSSKVSSRKELADAVGRQERTVDVVISGLRRKIGPGFVRNVRGRGWILDKQLLGE
ncbi:MAG: winged helix-turn-helix domain-containing protein [Actinomycetota bacterium]